METGPTSVQESMPILGYPKYKAICIKIFSSNSPVHVMETGSILQELGYIPKNVE